MFGLSQQDIEKINTCIAKYPAIETVVIYGSRAKGNYKNSSDIDLTIIDKGLTETELVKLEIQLDDLLLPYKIDLSLKRKVTNSELLEHIERVGKILYSKESYSNP